MTEDDLVLAMKSATWVAAPDRFCARFVFEHASAFDGHFPGNPLLPGAFQIEMVRLVAESLMDARCTITEVTRAKFSSPIHPGEEVRVQGQCRREEHTACVQAMLTVGETVAANLSLVLGLVE
jgi:3-hydroxymyristoyl/3-hydroxydecanoyl-(acyl carrier protein) dehydratase